ncbi:E3 ubiquitin-protein ligase KEG [Acorus calamus]|uniref:E3 ubiquitin-protein ligase KEG n=1 Tax=Acorus calamus TaxID=4465 RepID=A0AAV9DJ25_ACOCL|nr:E3 ubiquitin-protein ligase KEG [Acorus calamus]
MSGQATASRPVESFEYEFFDGDPDHLMTVVSTPDQLSRWINPDFLKLTHRIGRGPFGDVWIATHHVSTEDYDEHHEVAVKMLYPIKDDQVSAFLAKFDDISSKLHGIQGVCLLHGISVKIGKICIVMKFYEGSIGDKMAKLRGGKLSVSDVLRYGIDLAQGIMELHSRGLMVLNLKPNNFLLDEHDRGILGEFGIPSLLRGFQLPNSDMVHRLGTPNFMAPEQWQPDMRGPVSFETDSWGFACSIVEMLSGVQPWPGKSPDEIYDLVVTKKEKPIVPSGLPPPLENVLFGCFQYDFRHRPLMVDILRAFQRCESAASGDNAQPIVERSNIGSLTDWSILKDPLYVGDTVRSRKPKNFTEPKNMDIPEGTVVGLEGNNNQDAFVLIRVHGIHNSLRIHPSLLERVTFGFAAGDWVSLISDDSRIGILHSIGRDGTVTAGFVGRETLYKGKSSELQMAEPRYVGQFVRVRSSITNPRFGWPRKGDGEWATGRIQEVLPNGCLEVGFPGRLSFRNGALNCLANPAEVEEVRFETCEGWVRKYQHLEDFHWAVRPLVIAVGLFAALKVGFFIGGRSRRRSRSVRNNPQGHDGQNAGNPAWLPHPVANILFREGVATR